MSSTSSVPNRSSNPYPQFNDFGDARAYLDSLRNTLTYSWSGVEHVIKFLSDTLQEKINYIDVLRTDLTACQNSLNAKIYSMQQMDQTIVHLQRQLQEKDSIIRQNNSAIQHAEVTLQKVVSESNQIQRRYSAEFEESNKMRAKISSYEQGLRTLSAQNEQLKLKLTQAEEQQQQQQQQIQSVTNLEFNLTEEQEKKLREHIEKEITKRAMEVNARAKEKVVKTFKRWQERIRVLEEQLEAARAKNDTSDKLEQPQSVSYSSSPGVIQADPPPPQDQSNVIADESNSNSQQHKLEVVNDSV